MPVSKTRCCEANLIPFVPLDNIMDSYINDGEQKVTKKKQPKGTANERSKKAQLILETAKEDYQCQETVKQLLQEDPKKLLFYFNQ